jgi:hypothetical protein
VSWYNIFNLRSSPSSLRFSTYPSHNEPNASFFSTVVNINKMRFSTAATLLSVVGTSLAFAPVRNFGGVTSTSLNDAEVSPLFGKNYMFEVLVAFCENWSTSMFNIRSFSPQPTPHVRIPSIPCSRRDLHQQTGL